MHACPQVDDVGRELVRALRRERSRERVEARLALSPEHVADDARDDQGVREHWAGLRLRCERVDEPLLCVCKRLVRARHAGRMIAQTLGSGGRTGGVTKTGRAMAYTIELTNASIASIRLLVDDKGNMTEEVRVHVTEDRVAMGDWESSVAAKPK